MTTYVLAQLSIHDPERYGRYVRAFADTLAPFAGRLLVADARPQVLEGDWPHEKVVLIEFDDQDEADRWASSDAYVTIAADRRAATTATVLALRALDGRAGSGPPAPPGEVPSTSLG
jgi:uncharacterized protein (DUF1330 family)